MNRLPFYFSIDFEDFSFDYKRENGSSPQTMNVDPLWTSYEEIKSVFNDLELKNSVIESSEQNGDPKIKIHLQAFRTSRSHAKPALLGLKARQGSLTGFGPGG